MSVSRFLLFGGVFCIVTGCSLLHSQVAPAQNPLRPLSVEDLLSLKRVGAPALDASGLWVAYSVTEILDSRNNKSVSNLWVAPADQSLPAQTDHCFRSRFKSPLVTRRPLDSV